MLQRCCACLPGIAPQKRSVSASTMSLQLRILVANTSRMPHSTPALAIASLRPLVVALLLIYCPPAFGISVDDVTEKGAVQVLTSASWDAFLADLSKPLVVLHYAPWCGHCKRLLPDYEVASRRCARAVVFSKVDCTSQSGLCTGVNGYPHIKIHIKQDAAWSAREYALTAFPQYVFVTL